MSTERPNVLLVHCHDLGRYLGCYGADVDTPRIDRLAAQGAQFDRHFVTAPQCTPSRGSLMTGRFPHVNGLMGLAHGEWELDDDETILPQYLSDAGYQTHLFGLQHVTQDTDRLGYDTIHSEGNLYPGVSPAVHQNNRADDVAGVVSEFLEEGAFDPPFFGSVGFFELHRVEEDDGRFGFDPDYYDPVDPDAVRPLSYLPDRRGIRHDLAEMHGMVHAVDDGVGRILDALADAGLAEDTLLVFTTEHGIAFPRAKGSCYDAGIEAALLVRYPGLTDGGRYDHLLSNVDLLPTILDVVGLPVPDRVQGRSFAPLLASDGADGTDAGAAGSDGGGETDAATRSDGAGDGGASGTAGDGDEADGGSGDAADETDPAAGPSSHAEDGEPVEGYRPRERVFAEMTWHDMYNPVRAIRTDRYKYLRNFWHLPGVYLSADVFASEAGREVREAYSRLPRPYEELYDLQEAPQEDENVAFEPRYQEVRVRLSRELHDWMVRTDDPLLDGPVVPGDFDDVQAWPHEVADD